MGPDSICTPGRVSFVYFTHQKVHEALKDEEEGWMVKTAGGMFWSS